jgi:hypothetical protein
MIAVGRKLAASGGEVPLLLCESGMAGKLVL